MWKKTIKTLFFVKQLPEGANLLQGKVLKTGGDSAEAPEI